MTATNQKRRSKKEEKNIKESKSHDIHSFDWLRQGYCYHGEKRKFKYLFLFFTASYRKKTISWEPQSPLSSTNANAPTRAGGGPGPEEAPTNQRSAHLHICK